MQQAVNPTPKKLRKSCPFCRLIRGDIAQSYSGVATGDRHVPFSGLRVLFRFIKHSRPRGMRFWIFKFILSVCCAIRPCWPSFAPEIRLERRNSALHRLQPTHGQGEPWPWVEDMMRSLRNRRCCSPLVVTPAVPCLKRNRS